MGTHCQEAPASRPPMRYLHIPEAKARGRSPSSSFPGSAWERTVRGSRLRPHASPTHIPEAKGPEGGCQATVASEDSYAAQCGREAGASRQCVPRRSWERGTRNGAQYITAFRRIRPMTRTRFRFGDDKYPYFMTNTIVAWLPIFADPDCVDIVLGSWRFLQMQRGITVRVGSCSKTICTGWRSAQTCPDVLVSLSHTRSTHR